MITVSAHRDDSQDNSRLHHLHSSLTLPSKAWSDQSPDGLGLILLCKIAPTRISDSITINLALESVPSVLDTTSVSSLLCKSHSVLEIQTTTLYACLGSKRKDCMFYRYLNHPIKWLNFSTNFYEIISSSSKCSSCKKYRSTLCSMYHR